MKRFFLSFLMLLTLINWLPTHAEAQARTVSITGPEAANGEFDVTITFSGTVTGFARTDITVIGGTSTGTLEGSDAVYTVTIRPANVNKVRVSIPENVVNEDNSASNSLPVIIDKIAPTVSITQPSRIQKMAFMTTITFSEDVTGFDMLTDVVLTGTAMSDASISAINPISASVYEVTITPDINGMKGQLVISVPAMAAKDTAGNYNIASSMSATVDYNPNAPTVEITHSLSGTQTAAFDVTVTFSEAVEGFMAGDISLTGVNASASIGTPTGFIYPVTITPTSDGTLTIFMEAGVVMDAVDMEDDYNVASNVVTVVVDVLAPTVTVNAPDANNGTAFPVTFTFSEDVTGFVPSDLALTNATAPGSWSSQTARAYTASITPTIADGNAGEITIEVPAGAAQDGASNGNTASLTKRITVDREDPTVVSITAPTDRQSGNFPVTITFSEPVMGFEPNEVTVTDGASAPSSWSSGSDGPMTYTGTINTSGVSISEDSVDVTISVMSNRAEDAAGNGNSASSSSVDKTVTVDKKKPTPTIAAVSGTQSGYFTIMINFDEYVRNFGLSGISMSTQSGDAAGTVSNFDSSNDDRYTARITPSGTGTLRISVLAGAAEDMAGNASVASMNVDVSVDTSGPTPTITAPTDTQNGPFDVTIDFGENVRDFTRSDVTVTNATKEDRWKSQTESLYVLTLTPTIADGSTGTVTIDVDAGVAEDTGSNPNVAASQAMVDIDKDAPTLTIDAPMMDQKDPFDVTFTFDQDVTGFEPSDVTVTNANKASSWKSDTATTYVLILTPTATVGQENTVTIDVAAGGAMDAATNGNEAATQASVMVDKKAPTVTISDVPSDVQNKAFPLTIMFDEDVTDFMTDDLIIQPSSRATATVSGSGRNYTATITPNANQEDDVRVRVRGMAAEDGAGNRSTVSADTSPIPIDTMAPTATISAPPSGEQNAAFPLTIMFSEVVTDFAAEDLRVTGPASATAVASVGASKQNYTATITPNNNQEGNVTVTVKANAVTDAAGNGNTVSPATPDIQIDTIAPTATITAPTMDPQNGAFDVTIDFGESVSGFVVGDLNVVGAMKASSWKTNMNGPRRYKITLTPMTAAGSTGTVTIDVDADAARDTGDNPNEAASRVTVNIDKDAPTLTIDAPTMDQKDPFDVTFTFDEDVTDFEPSDVEVTNANKASSWKSGATATTYVLRLTPTATAGEEETVTIDVAANKATDAATNGNEAATQASVTVDKEPPTMRFIGLPVGEQKSDFTVKIEFSERVKGFHPGVDLIINGPATTPSSSSNGNIVTVNVRVKANSEGDLTLQVKARGVTDNAGNPNTISDVMEAIPIDTLAPTVSSFGDLPTMGDEQNQRFDVTITFNDDVTGFAAEDLTVTGPATAALTPEETQGPRVFMVRITPNSNSEGDVTIQVMANAVTDTAGNSNPLSGESRAVHVDTIVPTGMFVNSPTTPQKDPFNVTLRFSEPVTGFGIDDILEQPKIATITLLSGSDGDMDYVLTVTPEPDTPQDTESIIIADRTVVDAADNTNEREISIDFTIDTRAPTVVAISGAPTTPEKDPFDLTITFSEDVTDFAANDLIFTPTGRATVTAVTAVTAVPGSDSEHRATATITPTADQDGNVTVRVKANAVEDAAGNQNTVSAATPNIHIDTIIPTFTTSGLPSGEQNSAFTLNILFSENVNGFAADDLNLGGGPASVTKVDSPDDNEYLVTITPTANREGDVTVSVNANAATDDAGNGNTALTITPAIYIDTIVPTVRIEGAPTAEQNSAYDLTIRFSERVNGFSITDDLTVTLPPEPDVTSVMPIAALTLKSGAPGAAVYVVTVTPNIGTNNIHDGAEGDVTVTVKANTVQDFATNANPAGSNTAEVHIDTITPYVMTTDVVSLVDNYTLTTDDYVVGPIEATLTFTEDVTGFTASDFNPSERLTTDGAVSGGPRTYTQRLIPPPNFESGPDANLYIDRSAVSDAAGNTYPTGSFAHLAYFFIDTIPPTVSVTGFPTTEQNGPFDLTVTFSEPVEGFEVPGDLTIEGLAMATLKEEVTPNQVYTVTITPNATSEGDVTVRVNADAVDDVFGTQVGNMNEISPETTSVHIDTIPPTVAIEDVPTIEQNGAYDLTIRFSEEVNGFSVADDLTFGLVADPPIAAVALKSGVDGDAVYMVTVTPNAAGAEGDVTVTVNATAVQDFALNANPTGSNAASVHVDTIAPTVSVSGFPTIEKNVPYDLIVTFSEPVNGFAVPADLTFTGPAMAALASGAPGASVYTVTITPNATAEGDVTVTVNATTVQDFALNDNIASPETTSVHVDTIIPTVSVSGFPPVTLEQNGPFTLTVTFSEEVNGFAVLEDLTLTGPVTAALASGADGDLVYTVTITPDANSEDDVTVTVNATTVQDFALNDNTASTETTSVHVDTIPPTVSMVVTPPVTIGQETGYPTQERNAPYTLTVTFSEEVNGFAVPADLTVTGPGTAALTTGADGASVYMVEITPDATSEGDVTVTVNPTTVADFATTQNPAGSDPVTVHIDTRPPTFTIQDTPVLQRRNDFFDIRVVFDDPVNDFRVPGDFTPTLLDLVTPSLQSGADGASEYTVRMTPNENVQGDLIIEINEESVRDFALNRNAAPVATTQPVRIDTIAPTVEITDLPTGVKNEPFDVTITFAEVVNGFTTQDIVLVGPATVALIAGTDGDAIYTARVTPNPNAMGNVTLQIPAAVVLDLAENANVASLLTPAIASDTNALTVELQKVPDTVQLGVFSVTIVFSNDVNGFVLGDIEITGDAVVLSSTLLGTGSTYMLNITPDENTDGDVTINVPAGVAQDAAGKSNAASVPQTIAVAPKWMPEAGLRDAFREQLNLGAGTDFTQQQLRAITTIEAEMSGMTDLTGLEQATALTSLVIPGNEITSITPLKQLTKLTSLNLAGNAITDITPLSGLTALTTLNLGGNSLTDISAIKDLTNLTELDLSNNALTDISLLENFTELTTLNLASNRITDISALTVLTKLTMLNLNDNPIGDFTPITGLTALTTLELGGTGLTSLNAISGLKALTALNLRDNSLTDIALLADLTALTALNLSENTISSLTVLSGLTGLTLLNLNDNAIIDITPLSSLTRLTTLELADNAITSLTPLSTLTLLSYLDLRENAITDVGPIVGLTNLDDLYLVGNPILNAAPLYTLTQPPTSVDIDIEVSQYPPWDVNEDGTVDALDSALVTAALGQSGDAIIDPRTDVNGDGTVDNADLTLVTTNLEGGVGGAPSIGDTLSLLDPATLGTLDRATLETYLNSLRLESDGSLKYRHAIALLESLLAVLRPTQTRLLANYPNPFNPETWLPYELALDSTVELFIYDARGALVRHLELGHQPAGYYIAKSRAVYWDGRNSTGERVSSGIYFYQLRAGSISQLRKMVILK